jgi:hypothetical protein
VFAYVSVYRTSPHQLAQIPLAAPVSPASPGNGGPLQLVRKCMGKNKQAECLQNQEHNNTRWECSFETPSKDEFMKHCKNIYKRVKWRELGM